MEPLLVGQTAQQEDFVIFLKESNLTAAQVAGGVEIPKAQVRWQFKEGRTLPHVLPMLPLAMANCIFMQGAECKDDDFFRGRPSYG